MAEKTNRRWQLQDILHAAGEEGLTQTDYGEGDGNDGLMARREPHASKLKGEKSILNLREKTGLPACFSYNANTFVFRAIITAMRCERGAPPTLQWVPPITCSTQMKISLEDYQLDKEDDRRYTTVILRSQPLFAQRPAMDNIKVWIEEDAGRKLYFAL